MKYIAIDIETNGTNPEKDDILLISAVKLIDGKISETFSKLVKPTKMQTDELELFTGISNKDLENADSLENVIKEFCLFAKGCTVVSYDDFEYYFLNAKGFFADKIIYLREYLKKNYDNIQKFIVDAVIITLGLEKELKTYINSPMFYKKSRLFYSLKVAVIFKYVCDKNFVI